MVVSPLCRLRTWAGPDSWVYLCTCIRVYISAHFFFHLATAAVVGSENIRRKNAIGWRPQKGGHLWIITPVCAAFRMSSSQKYSCVIMYTVHSLKSCTVALTSLPLSCVSTVNSALIKIHVASPSDIHNCSNYYNFCWNPQFQLGASQVPTGTLILS